MENEMKVYVGTYAKYNNGSLYGKWLDLSYFGSYDDFICECKDVHKDEADPELMFQDHEGILGQMIGESWISEKIWELMECISFIKNEGAFLAFIDNYGYDLSKDDIHKIEEKLQKSYQGKYDSELDFTYDYIDDSYDLEEMIGELSAYFDYEAYSRYLFLDNYDYINGYVFLSN